MTANDLNQAKGQQRRKTGRGVELVLWPTSLFFAGLFALFVAASRTSMMHR